MTFCKKFFKETGLKIVKFSAINSPGWPYPSGPGNIRLHKKYGNKEYELPKAKPDWEVPIIKYVKTDKFPGWMKALGKWDMTFRKGVFKLPMSHLFYVLGEK